MMTASVFSRRAIVAGAGALVAALALAACSDDDSKTPTAACTATLTGNLAATATTGTACASFGAGDGGDMLLAIAVPNAASLTISIDVGSAPSVGMYSSETVGTWSATAARATADDATCVYAAGAAAVPTGSFSLDLTAVDEPHGTLTLVQYVQAPPGEDCGAGDNEMVSVAF